MAKDQPTIPTERKPDSKGNTETTAGDVIVVGDGESVLHPRKGKTRKINGIIIRSTSGQRVEVAVMGVHVIFEPRSCGPVPKALCENIRFKEAVKAYNLEEVKEK